jgi:hypothetical protein
MSEIVYVFKGKYSFLSNFYQHDIIKYHNLIANDIETLYQASKTINSIDKDYILSSYSPGNAKRRGTQVLLRSDWEDVKVSVMKDLLSLKFAIPFLRKALIDTKGIILIEGNYWGDQFWGVCNGKGENKLGELLMELRRSITNEPVLNFNRKEIYARIYF